MEVKESVYIEVQTPQEDLLKRVSPEVQEVLGRETVVEVEELCEALNAVQAYAEAPNPFKDQQPGDVDLSFLKPKDKKRIDGVDLSNNTVKEAEKLVTKNPLRMHRRQTKLLKVADATDTHLRRQLSNVHGTVNSTHKKVERVVSVSIETPGWDMQDVSEILEYRRTLTEIATRLPSEATIRILEKLRLIANTSDDLWDRQNPAPSTGPLSVTVAHRLNQISNERVEFAHRRTRHLLEYKNKVSKLGEIQYELLRIPLQDMEADVALDILTATSKARQQLVQSGGKMPTDQLATLLPADNYLMQKANEATTVLRTIDPEMLRDPDIRNKVQKLQQASIAKLEQNRRYAESKSQASSFNTQVTEARDILLGGRRLKDEHCQGIIEKSDALRQLAVEEQPRLKLLEPPQAGILLAIVSERFTNFLEVLARVQTSDKGEIIRFMEQEKPEVMRSLRGFDIEKQMRRIQETMSINRNRRAIRGIFDDTDMAKIDATIREFAELHRKPNTK